MNAACEHYEAEQQKADRAMLVWQQASDDCDVAQIVFDEAVAESARARRERLQLFTSWRLRRAGAYRLS